MTSDPHSLAMADALSLQARVRVLRQQVPGLCDCDEDRVSVAERLRVSSGWPALDALLPERGFLRGSLVEWLAEGPGSGAGSLALHVAWQASQQASQARAVVILDRRGEFYVPAAAAWQLDLRRLILLRPRSEAEALWALDQALRCPAVAAVWASLDRLEGRWFRRFQLAAECSGCLGLLLRPLRVRGRPSWAEAQLMVQPQPADCGWRWRVELLRCRGQQHLGHVEFQLDELSGKLRASEKTGSYETHSLPLVPPLADPKTARRSTRA